MSYCKKAVETVFLDLLVDKKDIIFINSIVESYDGIAFFRTIDPSIGHVLLMVPPAFIGDVDSLLRDLRRSLNIRPMHEEQARQDGFSFFACEK